MKQQIEKAVAIQAPLPVIWDYLTDPELMMQWMGEPEMQVEINTDWIVGHLIVIQGFHHGRFENRGKVLEYLPYSLLRYDYLSSVSRLSDATENYTVVDFKLAPLQAGQIQLQSPFAVSLPNRFLNTWTFTGRLPLR